MSNVVNTDQTQWRVVLSGLWIFFLLNVLFRDVHEFFRNGFLEQALSGIVNGNIVTEENLTYAALALQVPLLMTVLSLLLASSMNRWFNLITSTLMFLSVVAFINNPDMDDIVFASVQGLALWAIFWFACKGTRFSC